MTLMTKQNNFLLLTLLLGLSACSSLPPVNQVPTEDRTPAATQTPAHSYPEIEQSSNEQQYTDSEIEPIENKPLVPVSPAVITPSRQSPAVIALLESAQQYNQQGDIQAAQSSLQRAQRIAPQDPEIYYALANIHRNLQDYALAEQVALKGVSIVQGQAVQLRRFWLLIADIRQDAGNTTGSKKAKIIADNY